MDHQTAFDSPSQVSAEDGNVIVDGPDGVAITMSPAAAEETANRLLSAVAEARSQDAGESASRSPRPPASDW